MPAQALLPPLLCAGHYLTSAGLDLARAKITVVYHRCARVMNKVMGLWYTGLL